MTKLKADDAALGCLYVVATPIGNLEDITLRALRILKEADAIACEDTRQTLKLLSHFDIQKRLISYHEHNEITRAPEIVIELEQGAKVALVSDAGTPAISDPGHRLVSLCLRHGIQRGAGAGSFGVCGGAGRVGNAGGGVCVCGISAVAAERAAQGPARAGRGDAHAGALRSAAPAERYAGRCAGNSGEPPGGGGAGNYQDVRGVSARASCRTLRLRSEKKPFAGKSRC